MTSKKKSLWLITLLTVALIALIVYFTQFYWSKEEIATFLSYFGPFSIIVYVGLVVLFNVAAPLSASPIMLLGFALYGQWSVLLFALGNFIAMAINFWIARRFGRRLIHKIVGEESMEKVDAVAQDYGLAALFIIRMFVSGISDLASYAFGLTPIKFKSYMVVSIIASLPPLLLFVALAGYFDNPIQLLVLQVVLGLVLSGLYVAGRFIVGWQKQKQAGDAK